MSQSSAWPLHWQGWQLGKPQCPGRHRSHCRAYMPWKQWHWPVTASQKASTDPCRSQSQAADRQTQKPLRRQTRPRMCIALMDGEPVLTRQVQSTALPSEVRESPRTIPGFITKSVKHLRLHPLGPKPKVPGAHLLHVLPTTLGRHGHWPPLGSHTELREPCGSHSQAAGERAVRLRAGSARPARVPRAPPDPFPTLVLN